MNQEWRTSAVLTAIVLAAIAAGCGEITNPTRPTYGPRGGVDAASQISNLSTPAREVVASSPDPAATLSVVPELAAVRAATAKYHDISSAYAAGYTTQFEPCVENPGVGVMGIHARNEPLMGDQLLDPLQPELLLYAPTPNGG